MVLVVLTLRSFMLTLRGSFKLSYNKFKSFKRNRVLSPQLPE
jgi:hypothetical protein